MYFWIAAACVIACIHQTPKGSAARIVLWTWTVAIVLPALPVLHFTTNYSPYADALIGACLISLTAGYTLIRNPANKPPAPYAPDKEAVIAWSLAGLGAIGSILLLIDNGAQLSVGYVLDNLASIRAASFDQIAQDTRATNIAIIGGFLAPCSILAIIAAVKLRNRWLAAAALFDFALLAIGSLLLLGGRTNIFIAVLVAAVSWRLAGGRISFGWRTWASVTLAAVVVAYFSVSWVETRQGAGFSPQSDLLLTQRAEVYPWAQDNPNVATALLSFGYFASPLPSLSYYMQRPPLPGPLYGAYSLELPAVFAAKAQGVPPPSRASERAQVFEPFESNGYFGNVWASIIRDLLVDFWWPGALVCFAIFGLFLAWARNRYERTGALHYHYLETIACYTVAFGAFTSYLPNPMIFISLCTALAVMLATRLTLNPVRASALRA